MNDDDGKGGLSVGWIVFWIVVAIAFLIAMRNGGETSGCENWVQDPRGGYCE